MSVISNEEKQMLISQMIELLEEYDYSYKTFAIESIIDEWAQNKANLITAFKKHPNYKEGQFMIAFDYNYERKLDPKETNRFSDWVCNRDQMHELRKMLPEELVEHANAEDAVIPRFLYNFFRRDLRDMIGSTITQEYADHINALFPDMRARAGQRTARVVNKICNIYHIDKLADYNKMFARFADSLTPLIITRHTALSINPMDYLTMSFGNSWASCHTIDKSNKRRMPNNYSGCYSSGTMSYMLDPSSMVFYTVDGEYNGDKLWNEPKITRQMFHWGEGKLVQARLYPQANDGDGSVYTPNRTIVQEIMALIMEEPNLWTLKRGRSTICDHIRSYGTHYRDYENFNDCTLSILKDKANENPVKIGHDPICIECGEWHEQEDCINCCNIPGQRTCSNCGDSHPEDEMEYIDGDWFCHDCCSWCEYCESYHLSENTYVSGHGYVCETCISEDFVYCDGCNNYVHEDDGVTYIESEDMHVCDRCLRRHFTTCDECEAYIRRDDANMTDDGLTLCDDCYDSRDTESNDEEAC